MAGARSYVLKTARPSGRGGAERDLNPKGSEERGCTSPGCFLMLFHVREKYTSFLLQPLSSKASGIYSIPNTYEIHGQSRPRLGPTAPGKFKVMAASPDTWASRFVSTRRKFSFISGQNKVAPLPSSLDKSLCRESSGHGQRANYQAPVPAQLPTCLSSSRKMSSKQHLCQEAEGLPASLHKDSTFVTPVSAAKKSLFLPEPLRSGEAAGSPSKVLELRRHRPPRPESAARGTSVQVRKPAQGKWPRCAW